MAPETAALIKSWPMIVFFACVIFQAGGTFYMILYTRKDIKDLKLEDKLIKKDIIHRLYDDKSQPIYTTIETCKACRLDCSVQRSKDMDYICEELRDQKVMLKSIMNAAVNKSGGV